MIKPKQTGTSINIIQDMDKKKKKKVQPLV